MKKLFTLLFCIVLFSSKAVIFSIYQYGDLHTPHILGQSGPTIANLTNTQNFILTHTNDGVYNFVGVISPGDLMEQDSNYWWSGGSEYQSSSIQYVQWTNFWYGFTAAGLFAVIANGNHDCDATNSSSFPWGSWTCNDARLYWNTVFPISFFSNQTGFVSSRYAGDSKNLVMAYTNGLSKFLFITTQWSTNTGTDVFDMYSDQITWVSNTAALYPDHNVIVLSHFYIDGLAQPNTNDLLTQTTYVNIGIGSTPFTNGWTSLPNLMLCIGGHTQPMRSGHYSYIGSGGNVIDVSCFNMQRIPDSAAFGKIWTFDTGQQTVTANTFCITNDYILTNYDVMMPRENAPSVIAPGYPYFVHNWTVPFAVPFRATIYNFLYHQ